MDVVYSPGTLVAGARADRGLFGVHDAALRAGIVPKVAAMSLAECDRRTIDAPALRWLLEGCDVVALDGPLAMALVHRRREIKGSMGLLATEEIATNLEGPSAIVVDGHEARYLALPPAVGRLVLG